MKKLCIIVFTFIISLQQGVCPSPSDKQISPTYGIKEIIKLFVNID